MTLAIVNDSDKDAIVQLPSIAGYQFDVRFHTKGKSVTLYQKHDLWSGRESMFRAMGFIRARGAMVVPFQFTDLYTMPGPGTIDVSMTVRTQRNKYATAQNALLTSNTASVTILP